MNKRTLRLSLYAAGACLAATIPVASASMLAPAKASMGRFSSGLNFVPVPTLNDTVGIRPMDAVPAPCTTVTPTASPKQAESVPTIYGSIISSKAGADGSAANAKGMWSFGASGPIKRLNTNGNAQYGGAAWDNGNYYAVMRSGTAYYIDRFTISTWKRATHTKLTGNQLVATDVAYDPTSDMVYGCFYNDAGNGYVFGRADYTTRKRYAIKPLSIGYNAVMADASGQIYAIDMTGMLLKIDKATGEATNVGHTSVTPQYVSSGTIDLNTGRCYWCVNPASGKGYLYEVSLTTGQATLLHEFVHSDEITGLYIPESAPSPEAPGIVSDFAATFTAGALTGTVSFTLPAVTVGASQLVGSVDYTLWVDGLEYASAQGTPGANVSLPVTLAQAGIHSVVVRCSNASGAGPRAKTKVFAGNDTPKAPVPELKRTGDCFAISWKRVTASVNNGYIDPERLTYKVTRLPDNVVVAQAIADTMITDAVAPTPGRVIAYKYSVTATFEGNEGATGTTDPYPLGEITAPWSEGFDNAEAMNNFIIIDSNADGVKWGYSASMSSAYITNSKQKHDDWLISPAIRMEKGVNYKLVFEALASFYPERIEVRMGRSADPAAMTTELVPPTDLDADFSFKPALPEFTVPESGLYYIGWHAISDAESFYLYLDNITLTDDAKHEADAITPPYLQTFSESAALKDFIIVDANNDGYMWNVDQGEARVMCGEGLDDWLISPPVKMEAGKRYEVSLLGRSHINTDIPTFLELRAGTVANIDSMTTILVPATGVVDATMQRKLAHYYAPPTDGNYYIAIHAYGGKSGVYVDNFRIASPVTESSPAAPSQCAVTPAPYGELSASVSCIAPVLTVGGQTLQSLDKVEVIWKDSVMHVFTGVKPGDALECKVQVDESGTHDFIIVAYNAAGAGIPAECSAYVGVNVPSLPTDVVMTEEGNSGLVKLSWRAPKTDVNGNLINPAGITYIVADVVNGQSVLLARDIADTTFSVQAVAPDADQKFKTYAVFASNSAGMSKGVTSNSIPVGKPYTTPYAESFPNGAPSHLAVTQVIQPEGQWNTYQDGTLDVSAQDGDNGFCGFVGGNAGAAGVLFTGKIDLGTLDRPYLKFWAYNPFADNTNEIEVQLLDGNGMAHTIYHKTLAETGTNGWNEVAVSLKQFKGQTVRLALATMTRSYTMSLIDNMHIATHTGVDGIGGTVVTVTACDGSIVIDGAAGRAVVVADLQGRIRYSAEVADGVRIPVDAGVYIVRIGEHSYKIFVK